MQRGQSSKDENADLKGLMERGRREGVTLPMSPDEALDIYEGALTELEREEILNFPQVWFVGHMARKVRVAKNKPHTFGHDDKRNFYMAVISDHIAFRYEILKVVGQGSFGQVVMCWDHKGSEFVAIKIIRNNPRDRNAAELEVRILSALGRADEDDTHNIVRIKDHFAFRGHLCICMEFLGDNLHQVLKCLKSCCQAMVRSNAISLLKCLQLLKKERLVHGDLKPGNIVTSGKEDGHIKVIDFGLAHHESQGFTSCQTLWYRAPEVLLGNWQACGTAIDMWSLGCILAELSTGKVLFTGANEVDQMACIMEVLGLPSGELLWTATKKTCHFDCTGQPFHLSHHRVNGRKLSSILTADDPNFLDFITRCLKLDPMERLTPDEAMQHPWLLHEGSKPNVPVTVRKMSSITTAAAPKPSNGEDRPLLKREKMAPVRLAVMEESISRKVDGKPNRVTVKLQSHTVLKRPKVSGEQATGQRLPLLAEVQKVTRGGNVKAVRLLQQDRVGQSSKLKMPTACKKPGSLSSVSGQQSLHSKTSSITSSAAPKPSIREERPLLKREKMAPVRLAVMEDSSSRVLKCSKVSWENATGRRLPQLVEVQKVTRGANVRAGRLLPEDTVGRNRGESRLGVRFPPL